MVLINTELMAAAKWIYNTINAILVSIWGLTLIDLIAVGVGSNSFVVSGVDTWIKLIMAIAGAIYFIAKGIIELPHKYKMQKLELMKKRRELESTKKQGEVAETT